MGLKCFKDLFSGGVFSSFTQLVEKFTIPNSHHFRFLQIRSFTRSITPLFPNMPPSTVMDEIMCFDPTGKKALSRLMHIFSVFTPASLDRIKNEWEQDLQLTIDDDLWEAILQKVHTSSMCARHSLIQFKVVHRAHLSKTRLASIYPQISPICDKCGLSDATLVHMYWFCPALEGYWRGIFEALSTIFENRVDPNPIIALFGLVPDGIILPPNSNRIVAFTTLLARRLILMNWRGAVSPTTTHWIRDVLLNLKLEKIRYTIRGSRSKFMQTWKPFFLFFDKPTTCLQE